MDGTTCSIFLITWKSVSLKQNPPYSSNKQNWNYFVKLKYFKSHTLPRRVYATLINWTQMNTEKLKSILHHVWRF